MHLLTSMQSLSQPWGQRKRVMCARHGRKGLSLGLTWLLRCSGSRLAPSSRMGRSRGSGMERPGPLPSPQLQKSQELKLTHQEGGAEEGGREGPRGVGGAWLLLAFLCGC